LRQASNDPQSSWPTKVSRSPHPSFRRRICGHCGSHYEPV